MKKISVIVPAHNEEQFIGKCLKSIQAASRRCNNPVEVVVCLNRCTDNTESIARSFDVHITFVEEPNVAKVRNQAVKVSSGDVVIAIDADSTMSENLIQEVLNKMDSGRYVGGGILTIVDRINPLTIILGALVILPSFLTMRFSGGMFWFSRQAFDEVGGFDEDYLTGEDLQLRLSLGKLAKHQRKKYGVITKARIRTSARKLDEIGVMSFLKNPKWFWYSMSGKNQEFSDLYLYKTKRTTGHSSGNSPNS